jgi:pimeloyl-ACP methyl ester carboxylesterase
MPMHPKSRLGVTPQCFAARLALAGGFMLSCMGATPSNPFDFDQAPYTHAQRLVYVGDGRRLNLYCIGAGSPTVILDLGFGAPLISWGLVQPAIAAITRVCSYERAGYGFSDPGPVPRTTAAIVDDLHALLKNAGISPPYVMVGHSMAGLDVRLYADRYPSEMRGLVLIDPLVEGWDAVVQRMFPAMLADGNRFLASLANCERLAQDDQLQTRSAANLQCLPPPDPRFTTAVQAARDATKRRPGYWADLRSEAASEDEADATQLASAARAYGFMPLIVLSAPLDSAYYASYGATSEQVARLTNERREMRDRIVALSQRGAQCMVARTGHFIQLDRPDVVVAAIAQVVRLSQNDARPSCAGL